MRVNIDLDTTIKGFTFTNESIDRIFSEICSVEIDDNIILKS